uniref:Myb-like domain-containing protein n=1 Tax=Prymnesium polylepis TaxID=72548 RepID=A0A7S4J365_9EUKA
MAARAAPKSRAGLRTARTTQRGPKPATRVKKLVPAPKSRAAAMKLRSALHARAAVPPKAGKWTVAEDEQLVQAIGKQQRGKAREKISWQAIAALVDGRCAKQCRERWCNQLRPGLNTQQWTAAEDARLIELVGRIGRKWSQVAKLLQTSRGDNAVKNRYAKLAHAGRAGTDALPALAELLDDDELSSGELGEDGGDAMDLDGSSAGEEEGPPAGFDAGQLEFSSSQQAAAPFYADGTEFELSLGLEDDGADEFSFLCCMED